MGYGNSLVRIKSGVRKGEIAGVIDGWDDNTRPDDNYPSYALLLFLDGKEETFNWKELEPYNG